MNKITKQHKVITLSCDCKCCMFVIEKTNWEGNDVSYSISVQDSHYNHNYNTVWGRIKRACKILFGKPVYFNDVYIEDEEKFRELVKDMTELLEEDESCIHNK